MEDNLDSQFTNDMASVPERPVFLKVLCILTWVWCGLSFLSTLSSIALQPSSEKMEERFEKMREISPEAADKMQEALITQTPAQRAMDVAIKLIALGFSAYGAILMWKLKKTGFYLYIVGEALPYLGFLVVGKAAMSALSSLAGGMGAALLTLGIALMVIFDLVFIIMYAVNLKHMNK